MYFNVKSYLPDLNTVVCFRFFSCLFVLLFLFCFNNGNNVLGYKFYLNKKELKYNASSGFGGVFFI